MIIIKKEITIGLYGIPGTFNYGCEAIIRGTELILAKNFSDLNIIYASLTPLDDKKRLKGCNLEIVPRKIHPFFSASRANGIIARLTGYHLSQLYSEDLNWMEDCDIIFSVGGDNYNILANYKDSFLKRYYSEYIHFGDYVKNKGKKLVIWGASIGPYEENKKAKNVFTHHLRHVDLITSREPVTTLYLKKYLQINKNVKEFPDPAYAIPMVPNNVNDDKLVIGINLSPLSSLYVFGEGYDNLALENQVNVIEMLIKTYDADILLIPHVITVNKVNDDLRYLKMIKSKISDDLKYRVKIIDKKIGFMGTKEAIASCNLIIAARMHCAISAISAGVPTIFVSYSQKSKGMNEYVYGNKGYFIELNRFNSQNMEQIVRTMLSKEDYLKRFLDVRKENLRVEAYNAVNEVEKLL